MRCRFVKMTAWMMILALLLNMIPAFAEFSLPQGLTVIESEAFSNVPLQGIVTLPGNVSVVEEGAFSGEELFSLVIPEGTVSVEDQDCNPGYLYVQGLHTEVDDELVKKSGIVIAHEGSVVYEAADRCGVRFAEIGSIADSDGFMYECDSDREVAVLLCARDPWNLPVTELTVPEFVKGMRVIEVAENAFAHCASLEKISMPWRIEIAGGAFDGAAHAEIDYYGFPDIEIAGEVSIHQGDVSEYIMSADADDRYCFMRVLKDGEVVYTITGKSMTYKFAEVGSYTVEACISNHGKTVMQAINVAVEARPIQMTALKAEPDVTEAYALSEITWTAESIYGTGTPMYKFDVYYNGSKLASRAYNASNTYTYTFPAEGEYYVVVTVRDDEYNISSLTGSVITVSNPPEAQLLSVTADRASCARGEMIVWNAEMAQGVAPYSYEFTVLCDGTEVYAETNSDGILSYQPLAVGEYSVEVAVTDAYNTTDTMISGSVNVRAPYVTGVEKDSEMPLVDSTLTFTANLTGLLEVEGQESFRVFTVLYNSCFDELASSGSVSLSYTFTEQGEYTVCVYVYDESSELVSEYPQRFTVADRAVSITDVSCEEDVYAEENSEWLISLDGELGSYRIQLSAYSLGNNDAAEVNGSGQMFTMNCPSIGQYSLTAQIVDQSGRIIDEWTGSFEVLNRYVEIGSLIANSDNVRLGDDVVWTLTPAVCPAEYSCRFTLTKENTVVKYADAQMADGAFVFSHTFADAADAVGEYVLTAEIYNRFYSTNIAASTLQRFDVTEYPLTVSVEAEHSGEVHTGDEIVWKASVSGGAAPYEYMYILFNGEEEIDFQSYSEESFFGMTPIDAGSYTLRVSVRDALANTAFVDSSAVEVKLRPLVFLTGEVDESRVKPGETVTAAVTAEGGKAPLNYMFEVYSSDNVRLTSSVYSTKKEFSWTPDALGDYTIVPYVRDMLGTVVAGQAIAVHVYDEMTLSDLTVDVQEIRAWNDVTWTVTRTEGREACRYTWTVLCDGQAEATIETYVPELAYAPQAMGEYSVSVTADDGSDSVTLAGTAVNVLHHVTPASDFKAVFSGSIFGVYDYKGADPHVVIPEKINGNTVKAVRDLNSSIIEVLEIPEGVTLIDYGALSDAKKLRSVSLPTTWVSTEDSTSDTKPTYGPFSGCTQLKEITIPEGAVSVPRVAFAGATGLEKINLPSTLTYVGPFAFSHCPLESMTLPSGVKTIGTRAFYGCTELTQVDVSTGWTTVANTYANFYDDYYSDSPFYGSGITSITLPAGLSTIPRNAFSDLAQLKSITILPGVTSIADYSFDGCTGLTQIVLPSGLKTIGIYAFSCCTGLTEVVLPDTLTSIGSYAFQGCTGLKELAIPDSVTTIGANAFDGCAGLTTMQIPAAMTTFSSTAFDGMDNLVELTVSRNSASFTAVDGVIYSVDRTQFVYCPRDIEGTFTVPSGVTSIGMDAFRRCTGMTAVVLPDGLEMIGEGAFYGCRGLESITIPDTVTEIDDSAFYMCSSLADLQFGPGLTAIGESAFEQCSGLEEIVIPSGVTSLGYAAFRNCDSLKEITIPDSVRSIGSYAVCSEGNGLPVIKCSSGSYAETFAHKNTIVASGDFSYSAVSGTECRLTAYHRTSGTATWVPAYFDGYKVVAIGTIFEENTILTRIYLPDTVTAIEDNAFYGCTALSTLNIGSGVKSIGDSAIFNCGALTSLTIPDTVTTLAPYAIACNYKLRSIYLGSGVTEISDHCFYGNSSLSDFIIPSSVTTISSFAFSGCSGLTGISIPDTVTSIGKGAFGASGLKSITIPEGVAAIGERTFMNCKSLTSVSLPSSLRTISSYAFHTCPKLESLVIPEGVTTISTYAFCNNTSMASISLPSTLTAIGMNSFYNCTSLTSIEIPGKVTYINDYMFESCSGLKKIKFNTGTKMILAYAFKGCTSLEQIEIPSTVSTIYGTAFNNCPSTITIYGQSGSYAETLADSYGYAFVAGSLTM